MKLLTSIAAVLISISAFSQDYIEYDNGTFTQNGEELSMEQINDLTALHKAGKGNVRRANRFDRMHNDRYLRISNNGLNFIGGAASGVVGVFSLGSAVWLYSLEEDFHGRQATALGAVFCVVSYKAFLSTVSKEMCLPKRDEQFNKVAGKLNEAIKASNQ